MPIWCLGDTVGYGPRPNECWPRSSGRRRRLPCRQPRPARDRERRARSATSTPTRPPRARGQQGARRRNAGVPVGSRAGGSMPRTSTSFTRAHAIPSGSTSSARRRPRLTFGLTDAPVVLVGHSHVPFADRLGGRRHRGRARAGRDRGDARPRPLALQPRARSASRATAILVPRGCSSISTADRRRSGAWTTTLQATQAEIRTEGLPASLADRLALGV